MSAKIKIALARAKFVIKEVSYKLFLVSLGVAIGGSGVFISLEAPEILDVPPLVIVNPAEAATLEKIEEKALDTKEESVVQKSGMFYTYNAEESQTDGNPYRTASGKIVRDGIVANNCLAFGTKIEVEGVGILEVQDRMNSRYGCDDFDVFKENPNDNFKKLIKYKVL